MNILKPIMKTIQEFSSDAERISKQTVRTVNQAGQRVKATLQAEIIKAENAISILTDRWQAPKDKYVPPNAVPETPAGQAGESSDNSVSSTGSNRYQDPIPHP